MNGIQAILETVGNVKTAITERAGPLAVLEAIRPLLIEFSMSPGVLSDDAKLDLQHRVHAALRGAGLLETADLSGDPE